ncbi:zinc finger protein 709 [Diachasma alloeum]|uniref:zinc finger protein 709 n=1 Tax=Diachasma alloeum TaxID=454923 RepID=UPI0007382469|nr:zinc finger protein 709 [Diachasma alloeum]
MDRVCRICLTEATNLTPIFCTGQELDDLSGLPHKIQQCGAIEIHERDGLPSLICDVCIYKANVAHEFRQQCQHSDARLRLYYDKPPRTDPIETSTQTDSQIRILVAKKVDCHQQNYFVKEEMQNMEHDLTNSIDVYTQNHQAVVETSPIDPEDKLFLCQIGFDGSKEMEKDTVILEADPDEVQCSPRETQVLLEVPNDVQQRLQETEHAITEIKTSEAAQYLNEHLLTSTASPDEEEEEGIGVDDTLDADDDDIMDSEHPEPDPEPEPEPEPQPQPGLQPECQQEPEQVQEQALVETEALLPEMILPRRPTRKAKPSPGKSYSVDELDGEFESLGDDDHDAEEPKFKCKVCHKKYATLKGLKNHSQVHDKKHKCPTCSKLFYKLENMEKHSKIHETKPHACQTCHTSFAKPQSLVRHMKTHVDQQMEDSMNDAGYKKVSKLDNSDDEDDPQGNEPDEFENAPGLYKCDICNQFCSSLKNLKRHALVHGEKKYSCTVCKKWFFRPDTLKKHAEKHGHGLLDNLVDENKLFDSDDDSPTQPMYNVNDNSGKREESDEDYGSGEYKCQHCDKVMATMKGLRRHLSCHKPKAEPVVCEVCKKVCASRARLALHAKTHNKSKEKVPREYLCHICSKVYPSNSSLTYHMRTHTGVKPHVCKICNSGFTTTTSLANHIRIHTGDKPFVCHVCSAAFAVSSAFRRHLTRHTGEANYLCKTCGKAFKRLSTLKEHTYTHSGEKPYVCKTCGAAYSHSGSLFAHQKRCRAQYGELVPEEHHNVVAHHIHVNNVQTAVRSLAVIGQIF